MNAYAEKSREILVERFPGRAADYFDPITIGGTPSDMDEGARVILEGIKTATSTAEWEWSSGVKPFSGALSVLFDGKGQAKAVIEAMHVETIRFIDATEELAKAYGEGDQSLPWWKREMGGYYQILAKANGQSFDENTVLFVEWFKVVMEL